MFKVYIITEGSKSIGFGHISRCMALYQAFKDKTAAVEFIVNCDSRSKFLFKGIKAYFFNWIENKERLFNLISSADFVIIDSYIADKSTYDTVSALVNKNLLILDDFNRLCYPGGIIVNSSIYCRDIKARKFAQGLYIGGKDYVILRDEFCHTFLKVINRNIKNILITFGGSDFDEFVYNIIGYFLRQYPLYNFHVISNRLLSKVVFRSDNVKLYSGLSAVSMRNLILKCDLCVSAGGQTLFELAILGIPTIGICLADNQKGNLKSFRRTGFLYYAGHYRDPDIYRKVCKGVNFFMTHRSRRNASVRGKTLFDGKGKERIVAAIMKAYVLNNAGEILLRVATASDCYDLWKWRNHSSIREWSFNTAKIPYKKHKPWFMKKIRSRSSYIYIALNDHRDKIGQIRFDLMAKKVAYVNVNLNPEFFGNGLGNKIIKKASDYFMFVHPNAELIAHVMAENIASINAFCKAGYTSSGSFSKDGISYDIFMLIRRE